MATNSRGIKTIASVDDDYFSLDGEVLPKAWQVFPYESIGALMTGDGVTVIALMGSSIDGARPTSQAALVSAIEAVLL